MHIRSHKTLTLVNTPKDGDPSQELKFFEGLDDFEGQEFSCKHLDKIFNFDLMHGFTILSVVYC